MPQRKDAPTLAWANWRFSRFNRTLVITNVKNISATEAVTNYKQLWKIEDAFGGMKGLLKSRPIFHWTDKRIVGHLVICFLSYLCEAHMTKDLRERALLLKAKSIEEGHIKTRALKKSVVAQETGASVIPQ